MSTPTIYSIKEGTQNGQLAIDSVWTQTTGAGIPANLTQLLSLTVAGNVYIIGVDANNNVSAFQVNANGQGITAVPSSFKFSSKFDLITPLVIGNLPYVLTYSSAKGIFNFYPVNTDLSFGLPFEYYRNHDPGKSDGFTVVQAFTIFGLLYYIGYSFSTGKVCIYSLSVTASSTGGAPPLTSNIVWGHVWAAKWTRFAFFQLGGENFFLKTNVGKPNVNIDHVSDDPTQGTVEVGTLLTLPNELTLNIVVPFYVGPNPYFITYLNDGTTTFNRFDGDCKGWQLQASMNTVAQATQIVPFNIGDGSYALFY